MSSGWLIFKTRSNRLERVRKEVGARADEPVLLTEYLKPGLDEICFAAAHRSATWLRKKLAHKAHKLNVGLHVRTDTVRGFAMLCVLRSLRAWRRKTSRFASEQALIDRSLERPFARRNARAPELGLRSGPVQQPRQRLQGKPVSVATAASPRC